MKQLTDLKIGDKITVFNVSDAIAICFRTEYVVKGILAGTRRGEAITYLNVAEKGKRKTRALIPDDKWTIILKGHDLPVKADSDFNRFVGSAMFNLVADSVEILKATLEAHSVLEITDEQKIRISFQSLESFKTEKWDDGQLVYPIVNQD